MGSAGQYPPTDPGPDVDPGGVATVDPDGGPQAPTTTSNATMRDIARAYFANMPSEYSTISPATADAATVSGDARNSRPGPLRPL